MSREKKWLIFLLLVAFGVRVYLLTELPPGLTHDEANHGREGIELTEGIFRYYFPLNYGSEPLYSYLVGGFFFLIGKSPFALRLVTVFASLLAVAGTYGWSRKRFEGRVSLLAAGLIAFSFWPVASSREALRAGILPLVTLLAAHYFWQIYEQKSRSKIVWFKFALTIVAAFHIYLAARVWWLLFPLFALYSFVTEKKEKRPFLRATGMSLMGAAAMLLPMFVYLRFNPLAQTRLGMLDETLGRFLSGDWGPLIGNVWEGMVAFVLPGAGDQFLAYNIPGRPVLDEVTAFFFLLGLAVCFYRWRRPEYRFLLLWWGMGVLPSLITGATANTTRNLAALAPTFIIPAIGFVALMGAGKVKRPLWERAMAIGWLVLVLSITGRDYFHQWGNRPDVRAAYQHNLVSGLDYLAANQEGGDWVISTVYPGVAHDSSIGMVWLAREDIQLHWVDGRSGILFPQGKEARMLISEAAPLHPAVVVGVESERIQLRADDLDHWFQLVSVGLPDFAAEPIGQLGGVELWGVNWIEPAVGAGGVAELQSFWRVVDEQKIGPPAPPLGKTDMNLFVQLFDGEGVLIGQQDLLSVPSWNWENGDVWMQTSQIWLPAETAVGEYQTIVGIYDKLTGERLVSPIDQQSYIEILSLSVK